MRRLIVIDPDTEFHEILQEQVRPYGFELHVLEPSTSALREVEELNPELIFIAVEEPDKVGYSLCNKAKKGVAKTLPVILTTATVPPSGFNKHRKLRVHADEYIDKRTMNSAEILSKIGALISLGDAADQEGTQSLQLDDIEEIEFALGDIEETSTEADDSFVEEVPFDDVEIETQSIEPTSGEVFEEVDFEFESDAMDDLTIGETEPPVQPEGMSAALFDHDEATGVDEIPVSDETNALRSQITELQAQLEKERTTPRESGGAGLSKEREVLNLREMLNRKEKTLLSLRDEIGEKERLVLDVKERLRQLEHSRASLDEKNLQLEQRLLEATENLEERSQTIRRLEQQDEEQTALLQQTKTEHETSLAEMREQLRADKEQAIAELSQSHTESLNAQKTQAQTHLEDQIQALTESHIEKQKRLSEQNNDSIQTIRHQHTSKIETLQEEHSAAVRDVEERAAETQRLYDDLEKNHQSLREAMELRDEHLASKDKELTKAEEVIRHLRNEKTALEEENQGYQDQVLQAYERLKKDSNAASRAKKALAIALTVLDEEIEETV